MKSLAAFATAFALAASICAQDFSRLPPADKDEATRLFKIYKENTELETREKAVEMLLNMGKNVVREFTPAVEKDWQTALANYRAALPRLTAQFVQKKMADPAFAKELKTLREKLAKLRATVPRKEQLAEEGQAALNRLRAMHTVYATDLVPLQPAFHDMTQSARFLTRARAMMKAKGAPLKSTTDFSEEDLKREETEALSRAFWSNSWGVLKANSALVAQKAVPTDEAECVRLLNEARLLAGLAACSIDPKLHAAARDHCKDMATMNFFADESPVAGKKTPADRAKLAGTIASVENIAKETSEPSEVVQKWFQNPEHHLRMFANFRRVGVGRHEMFWTAMFGD